MKSQALKTTAVPYNTVRRATHLQGHRDFPKAQVPLSGINLPVTSTCAHNLLEAGMGDGSTDQALAQRQENLSSDTLNPHQTRHRSEHLPSQDKMSEGDRSP